LLGKLSLLAGAERKKIPSERRLNCSFLLEVAVEADSPEAYMISCPAAAAADSQEVCMMAAELAALVHSAVDFCLP